MSSELPSLANAQALRATLFARALPLPSEQGYTPLHTGVVATGLRRTCLGPGDEGTYYLTIYADATDSGDGRLSGSETGYLPTLAAEPKGAPVSGVDATGWKEASFQTPLGCWCCADGVCGVCGAASAPGCNGLVMPPPSRRKVLGYRLHARHLQFSAGLVDANSAHLGCVSFGQWRYYEVHTSSAADAQLIVEISAAVEGLYAAVDRLPSAGDFDQARAERRARHRPSRRALVALPVTSCPRLSLSSPRLPPSAPCAALSVPTRRSRGPT